MADTKITDLTSKTAASNDELVINDVDNGNVDKKVTTMSIAQVKTRTVMKGTTETISEDSTLSDDAELTVSVEASKYYIIQMFLLTTHGVDGLSADFKYNLSTPSSTTEIATIEQLDIWNAGIFTSISDNDFDAFASCGDSQGQTMLNYFVFKTSTTAGNATIQWSQNASTVSNTSVDEGSTIIITELGDV